MNTANEIQKGINVVQKFYETAVEYLVKYGFQVLGGLAILFIGWKLANWASNLFIKFCQKKKLDITLTKFLAGVLKGLILIFVILMSVEKFGVTISPLVASVSALIFGASFAIQAPLSNYAAGLCVMLTRPFVVGNTITIKGIQGVVEEVKLSSTILVSSDGDRISIPNKDIVGEVLFNSAAIKVVERSVGISYTDDPKKAIAVITDTLKTFSQVAQSPAPQIGIDSFKDSSVDIAMRYWVPTKEYYQTLHAVNLAVYEALKKANISIPFPQKEVRMIAK